MDTALKWSDLGAFFVGANIIVFAGEAALLIGAAFGAATSMMARERAGKPLVAWEPIVCGVGGAVLGGIVTIVAAAFLVGFSWPLLDAFSGYLFFAAGQGALIGLWVALYRTVGVAPPGSPIDSHSARRRRRIAVREP